MKKFSLTLVALWLCLSTFATTFNYNDQEAVNQTIDGITITLEKGSNTSNPPAYSSYNGMKLYAGNTITIDAATAFKNVQLVFSKNDNKDYLEMSASEAGLVSGGTSTALDDKKVDQWTGESTHLVFTMGTKGQRVLHQIVVDGDPVDINPIVYIDTTALDHEYVYAEPTAVQTPEMNFFKKEYAFINNNIRVSCTQGSILNNDTACYFNCNAGYKMTFEAAKPIKGVVINGAVRKLFSASVDKGDLTFLSPDQFYPEDYQESTQAVIIKNINATTVTLSCEKQLRCYYIYFYFNANPVQAIEKTDDPSAPVKILRDGQILILRGEKVFTMQGTEVK